MNSKIRIRKEVKVLVTILMLVFLIAFSESKQSKTVCSNIIVELKNSNENHFLDESDIMRLIVKKEQALRGGSMSGINLKEIEKKLKVEKYISDAQLFSDLKGNLIVHVKLRRPIARIVQNDAPDAYLAEDGVIMPISEKYSSRVILISGLVKPLLESENINTIEQGKQLMEMLTYIKADRFWNAQIAQFDIASDGKITIYVQVTGQRVEFGKPEEVEEKFKKLRVFYSQILPVRGWNRYKRVNLEYKGQVVAE